MIILGSSTHVNFYPLVTEGDGVWKRLKGYDKETLMKIAEQELDKFKKVSRNKSIEFKTSSIFSQNVRLRVLQKNDRSTD